MISPRSAPRVWDRPETVAGFSTAPPNQVLMAWVRQRSRGLPLAILDIGCGAGRNAVPLALAGHRVTGIDLSLPMLEAARQRAAREGVGELCTFLEGTMEKLPVPAASFDVVVAHGVWNLAGSDLQLVAAMAEAARAARTGAGLFVFTFSRNTLAGDLPPLPGQRQIYSQFSGTPQAFVTEEELEGLLASAGFERELLAPLTEYNRKGALSAGTAARQPVIWEGTWVRR